MFGIKEKSIQLRFHFQDSNPILFFKAAKSIPSRTNRK